MEKGWVKIFSTQEMYRAELIRSALENEGIEAVIINKKDSVYIMIGEIEIYVKQDNAVRALNIIRKGNDE